MRRAAILGPVILWGCRGGGGPTTVAIPSAPLAPAVAEPWTTYLAAAAEAERTEPRLLNRVSFFPKQRRELMAAVGPAATRVSAARGDAPFPYAPPRPGEVSPGRTGWRAIGRVLVWRVEDAAKAQDHVAATAALAAATRFGYAVAGGDAADATLGLTIAADARRAFLPLLPDLSRDELVALSKSYRTAIAARPKPATTARHEELAAVEAVRWLQENAGDKKALEELMGKDGADIFRYLDENPSARPAFFQGLLAEARAEADAMAVWAARPATRRAAEPVEGLSKKRLWRKAARHLLQAYRPVVALDDLDLARARLMAIEIEIHRRVRETGRAFPSIAPFSEAARRDPYTGDPFLYRSEGREFVLWSVGPDGKDDGGVSDAAGVSPDLVLENP